MVKKSREERRQDRKDAIKEAAIEIFSLYGYHNTKVSQIVSRVGVAQGTFYLYYESKEELFGELLQDFLLQVLAVIEEWDPSALKDVQSLRDSAFVIGLKLTALFNQNQELATIFFREGLGVHREFHALTSNFYDQLAKLLEHFHKILHRRGFIPKMNYELTSWIIIGAAERVVREFTVSKRLEHIDASEIVEHLLLYYLRGVSEPIPTEI